MKMWLYFAEVIDSPQRFPLTTDQHRIVRLVVQFETVNQRPNHHVASRQGRAGGPEQRYQLLCHHTQGYAAADLWLMIIAASEKQPQIFKLSGVPIITWQVGRS
jgi:hypothetical protein